MDEVVNTYDLTLFDFVLFTISKITNKNLRLVTDNFGIQSYEFQTKFNTFSNQNELKRLFTEINLSSICYFIHERALNETNQ